MPRQVSIDPDPFALMEKGCDHAVVYQFVEARFQGQGAGVVDAAYQYHHFQPPLLSSSAFNVRFLISAANSFRLMERFFMSRKFRKALCASFSVVLQLGEPNIPKSRTVGKLYFSAYFSGV